MPALGEAADQSSRDLLRWFTVLGEGDRVLVLMLLVLAAVLELMPSWDDRRICLGFPPLLPAPPPDEDGDAVVSRREVKRDETTRSAESGSSTTAAGST